MSYVYVHITGKIKVVALMVFVVLAAGLLVTRATYADETIPVDSAAVSPVDVSSNTVQAEEVTSLSPAPELSTDKADYHPGEAVSIFGNFFVPFQDVILHIFGGATEDENYIDKTVNIITDDRGSFNYTFDLSNFFVPLYNVVASTLNGEKLAETTFTDTVGGGEEPTLIVTKVVVNDNGGTAVVSSFPLSVDLTGVTSGDTNVFDVGVHVVSEVGSADYTAVISGDCDPQTGSVTLVPAEMKSCTITNDDKAPSLTLVKEVVNDNGGTATAIDFTLSASGPTPISGAGGVASGASFVQGTYSLSETNVSGYTASTWSCVGGTQDGSNITVGLGEEATCTITNDDQPGTLRVVKVVKNDNGGSFNPEDFSFSVNGDTAVAFETDGENDLTVNAGSYNIIEPAVSGYTTTYDNCSNVVVANGGEATCIITNDDKQAYVIVDKTVVNDNGGSVVANDFNLKVDGNAVLDEIAYPVNPGSHTVSEINLSGYTVGDWDGDCDTDGIVSVALGEIKTCTITNDDMAPQLIVIKHVINDDGGVAQASDFIMHLTGSNLSNNDFAGSESGVTVTLDAGSYSANEILDDGYVKILSPDCSGTIEVGETKTCIITNDDIPHTTRTLGFWQTHTAYTSTWFDSINPILIGTKTVSTTSQLFAGFYAGISKNSTNQKRSVLDQARIQMLQQWLAAKLNCATFGCGAPTQTLLTDAATAWSETSTSSILSYASQLDAYNNSNEELPVAGQGKATPSISKSIAATAISYWDFLP